MLSSLMDFSIYPNSQKVSKLIIHQPIFQNWKWMLCSKFFVLMVNVNNQNIIQFNISLITSSQPLPDIFISGIKVNCQKCIVNENSVNKMKIKVFNVKRYRVTLKMHVCFCPLQADFYFQKQKVFFRKLEKRTIYQIIFKNNYIKMSCFN